MSVYCIVNQTGRLSDPTKKLRLDEPLAYSNQRAHSFRFTVLAEGSDAPATLTGVGVTGQFLRLGNNTTVAPINGTVTGNVCEVILPASCYVVLGRYRFTMDISVSVPTTGVPAFSTTTNYSIGDEVVYQNTVWAFTESHSAGAWTGTDAMVVMENRTILWVEGIVERNSTEEIVDPGTPIPNVTAAINNANAAASAANAAATLANGAAEAAEGAAEEAIGNFAPAFAEATANAAGTYVTYTDGKMYLLPNGHTVNTTWANTTKSEVKVGGELTDLRGAFVPVESAVIYKQTVNATALGTGYLSSSGVYGASEYWKITVLPVTPGDIYDITAYFNAINASQTAKSMYSVLDIEATDQNYTDIAASHVLAVGGTHGNTYGEITDGEQTETGIVIPADAVCMVVSCTNIDTTAMPAIKKNAYISSAEMAGDIETLNKTTSEILNGISIVWNNGNALSTAGTLVPLEGYSASDLIQLTDIVKGATFKNIRQRISYTIAPICFYNASGTFLGYYTDSDAGNNAAITVKISDILENYTGATQIRIGKSDSDNVVVDSASLESLDNRVATLEEAYPPYNVASYPNILFCGDSVTYGYVREGTQENPGQIDRAIPENSYPACFGRIYGNNCTTEAQSGITIKQFYENKYPNITFSNYNMVIFELGLNPGQEGYLNDGDLDKPGKSAYIYKQMIAGVRTQAPDITIVLMRSQVHMGANALEAIEAIAQAYNGYVIDLADTKYINLNKAEYHGWYTYEQDGSTVTAYDDTHFSRIGYAAKAYDVIRWLGALLPD